MPAIDMIKIIIVRFLAMTLQKVKRYSRHIGLGLELSLFLQTRNRLAYCSIVNSEMVRNLF